MDVWYRNLVPIVILARIYGFLLSVFYSDTNLVRLLLYWYDSHKIFFMKTTNKKLVSFKYKIKSCYNSSLLIVVIKACLYDGGVFHKAVWSVVGCLANDNGGHYASFQAYQCTAGHNTFRPQYSCELCLQIRFYECHKFTWDYRYVVIKVKMKLIH